MSKAKEGLGIELSSSFQPKSSKINDSKDQDSLSKKSTNSRESKDLSRSISDISIEDEKESKFQEWVNEANIAGVKINDLLIDFADKKFAPLLFRTDNRDPETINKNGGFEGWKKNDEFTVVTPPIFSSIPNDFYHYGELPTNHDYKINNPKRNNPNNARIDDELSNKLPSDLGANVGIVCAATCPQLGFVSETGSWLYMLVPDKALPVTSLFSTEEMRKKNKSSQVPKGTEAVVTYDRSGNRIFTLDYQGKAYSVVEKYEEKDRTKFEKYQIMENNQSTGWKNKTTDINLDSGNFSGLINHIENIKKEDAKNPGSKLYYKQGTFESELSPLKVGTDNILAAVKVIKKDGKFYISNDKNSVYINEQFNPKNKNIITDENFQGILESIAIRNKPLESLNNTNLQNTLIKCPNETRMDLPVDGKSLKETFEKVSDNVNNINPRNIKGASLQGLGDLVGNIQKSRDIGIELQKIINTNVFSLAKPLGNKNTYTTNSKDINKEGNVLSI